MTRHAAGHAVHRAVSEVCDPENLNKSNNNKSLKRLPVCPTQRCCCQTDGLKQNQANSQASLLSPVNPASSISSFPVLLLSFLFEAQTSESFVYIHYSSFQQWKSRLLEIDGTAVPLQLAETPSACQSDTLRVAITAVLL